MFLWSNPTELLCLHAYNPSFQFTPADIADTAATNLVQGIRRGVISTVKYVPCKKNKGKLNNGIKCVI